MTTNKYEFKVGDKLNIDDKCGTNPYIFVGFNPTSKNFPYVFADADGYLSYWNDRRLEEMNARKLIAFSLNKGEKYILEGCNGNPYTFLGFSTGEYTYAFESVTGEEDYYSKDIVFYPVVEDTKNSQNNGWCNDYSSTTSITKRYYYYDCPIEAAYMAKNFGIKLYAIHSDEQMSGRVFYIHTDSLPIFRPRIYDIEKTLDDLFYVLANRDTEKYWDGRICNDITHMGDLDDPDVFAWWMEEGGIVKRDDKLFFWPKCEEV